MIRCSDSRSCVLLLLCFTVFYISAQDNCDKSKCRGPLNQYEALNCKPVYANPGECCPARYDCSHLKNLDKYKCYVNGHEYNIGEELRSEDKNPCEEVCTCKSFNNETAFVHCYLTSDCGIQVPKKNCFFRYNHDSCCPGPQVCLKEGETRATCEVDGIVYKDGYRFTPKSDPDLNCYCMPGYTGENVEPFCKRMNRSSCSPLFRHADIIHKNCAPIFYENQNPQKDCSYSYRCQNANDTVIHNHDGTKFDPEEEDKMCVFGDLKMHIGDELNPRAEMYGYAMCMECVCEVPPIPTCQVLANEKCNITNNPPIDIRTFG